MSHDRKRIIANNIKKYIKKEGITQKQLAEAINISPSTMSDYMNLRSHPSWGVIQRIADYFGIKKTDIDTTWKDFEDEIKPNYTPNVTSTIAIRDKRDIERQLEALLNDTSEQGGFAAYGGKHPSEMTEQEYEDHILFKNAIKETLRIAKRINREKHIPEN